MLKMKSALYIVAIFALALVSCVNRVPVAQMPDADTGAITMIKATVKPLELEGVSGTGIYEWSEEHNIGIYSEKSVNERYVPVKTTTGSNEAYFYGNTVSGVLRVYMPYSSEGIKDFNDELEENDYPRVTVPAEQKFYADAFNHLMYNSTFYATSTKRDVEFGFYAGLLKVNLVYDVENVASVSVVIPNIVDKENEAKYSKYCAGDLDITEESEPLLVANSGKSQITVSGFENASSSVAEPLTVWVAMIPGLYENLMVDIWDGSYNAAGQKTIISLPVQGPFEVLPLSATAECNAKKSDLNFGVGDNFGSEEGEFN